jgi:hypothetical protein
MNVDTARQLRHLLANSEWLSRTRAFATALRTAGHHPGGLLLLGTPDDEPWHFAAHLDDAARLTGHPELAPTLVRHHIPAGARPHLAIGLTRLSTAARGETVLVVASTTPAAELLERIDDTRRRGATIFTVDAGDHDLHTLAHVALTVADPHLSGANTDLSSLQPSRQSNSQRLNDAFDVTQHLVSLIASEPLTSTAHVHRRLDRILARSQRR